MIQASGYSSSFLVTNHPHRPQRDMVSPPDPPPPNPTSTQQSHSPQPAAPQLHHSTTTQPAAPPEQRGPQCPRPSWIGGRPGARAAQWRQWWIACGPALLNAEMYLEVEDSEVHAAAGKNYTTMAEQGRQNLGGLGVGGWGVPRRGGFRHINRTAPPALHGHPTPTAVTRRREYANTVEFVGRQHSVGVCNGSMVLQISGALYRSGAS